MELEHRGASLEELLPYIGGDKVEKVLIHGELDSGMAYCGQVVGLINEIVGVKELISNMVDGAKQILQRLHAKGALESGAY